MKTLICRASELKPLPADQDPCYWQISDAFKFYNKTLKPLVAQNGLQPATGIHGLETHTAAVVFRGIDYALNMNCDPTPVIFACAFHDMARTNDGPDKEHGKHAIPAAIRIMKQFTGLLNQDTRLAILYAILNHTTGMHAPDYISACTWDADRTRLAWRNGFDEKFFSTVRGKYVAQHWKRYLDYQKLNFPAFNWVKQY